MRCKRAGNVLVGLAPGADSVKALLVGSTFVDGKYRASVCVCVCVCVCGCGCACVEKQIKSFGETKCVCAYDLDRPTDRLGRRFRDKGTRSMLDSGLATGVRGSDPGLHAQRAVLCEVATLPHPPRRLARDLMARVQRPGF